ncbi:MAG: hypothetical protein P8075_07985 [Deltaproteobacteria bacterium]
MSNSHVLPEELFEKISVGENQTPEKMIMGIMAAILILLQSFVNIINVVKNPRSESQNPRSKPHRT